MQAQHGRNLSVMDNGFTTAVTEDEGDTEAEGVSNTTVQADRSADELKRMLSIGRPAALFSTAPQALFAEYEERIGLWRPDLDSCQ